MIKFDPTISLGTIITVLSIVGSIVIGWALIYIRLAIIETKIQPMWEWWNSDNSSENKHFESKIEHAVRGAAQSVVAEVISQDRRYRDGG